MADVTGWLQVVDSSFELEARLGTELGANEPSLSGAKVASKRAAAATDAVALAGGGGGGGGGCMALLLWEVTRRRGAWLASPRSTYGEAARAAEEERAMA